MSQKLPVNGFKWINDVTRIDEQFIQNYNEDNDKGYIREVDVKYPKKLHDLHVTYHFYLKEWKLINARSSYAVYAIRKNMLYT